MTCCRDEDIVCGVVLELAARQAALQRDEAAACTACQECDSSLLCQPTLCDNGACAVLYKRTEARQRLQAVEADVSRLRAGDAKGR